MAAAARRLDPNPLVLVVEDEGEVGELISEMLENAGYDTHCVGSDRAAYSALAATRTYAALVVDINLGSGTTGYDVARFARQMRPDIAVLYVTGQASEGSFKAFGVPKSGYMPKPFEPEDLLLSLKLLIGD